MSYRMCVCSSLAGLLVDRFVGHLYAAESLVLLDRIPEALHYLTPDTITDISSSLSSREDTLTSGHPHFPHIHTLTLTSRCCY